MHSKGFALFLLVVLDGTTPGAASDVGKRYPSEKRTVIDKVTGATITALTTSPASDVKIYQTHPQWTPDGRHIVFHSNRAGRRDQAFAIDEQSGEIVQLTDEPKVMTGRLCVANKANRLYLFRGNQLVELALDSLLADSRAGTLKAPAQYERIILSLPNLEGELRGFAIDADDRRAYIGNELTGQDRSALSSIDLQSGQVSEVVTVPFKIGHVQANRWVPGEVVYCHETGGDAPQRMWIVQADGSGNRPLYEEVPLEWVTHEVIVAPDHILFNVSGGKPDYHTRPTGIMLVNLRTKRLDLVGQAPGQGYWHCAATPDLKWAVGDTHTGEIHRINLANGERTVLTTGHKPQGQSTHAHQNISPDGRRVLFGSGLLGNSDLMTVPLHPEPGPR